METKTYSLQATHPALSLLAEYKEEGSDEIKTAVAYVNYAQDRVWFPNNPELNTDEMRRAVLATLDTPIFNNQPPEIPADVLEQIERIRTGKHFEGYGHVNF